MCYDVSSRGLKKYQDRAVSRLLATVNTTNLSLLFTGADTFYCRSYVVLYHHAGTFFHDFMGFLSILLNKCGTCVTFWQRSILAFLDSQLNNVAFFVFVGTRTEYKNNCVEFALGHNIS